MVETARQKAIKAVKWLYMDKISKEERVRASARGFDLGEGISLTESHIVDGKEIVDYFFTNKVDGVKLSSKKALGLLEVEFSSTQTEDELLLKKLHSSIK